MSCHISLLYRRKIVSYKCSSERSAIICSNTIQEAIKHTQRSAGFALDIAPLSMSLSPLLCIAQAIAGGRTPYSIVMQRREGAITIAVAVKLMVAAQICTQNCRAKGLELANGVVTLSGELPPNRAYLVTEPLVDLISCFSPTHRNQNCEGGSEDNATNRFWKIDQTAKDLARLGSGKFSWGEQECQNQCWCQQSKQLHQQLFPVSWRFD
nr:hypothetical protein Iba_chr09eCG13380 [Ipomoea batatas]